MEFKFAPPKQVQTIKPPVFTQRAPESSKMDVDDENKELSDFGHNSFDDNNSDLFGEEDSKSFTEEKPPKIDYCPPQNPQFQRNIPNLYQNSNSAEKHISSTLQNQIPPRPIEYSQVPVKPQTPVQVPAQVHQVSVAASSPPVHKPIAAQSLPPVQPPAQPPVNLSVQPEAPSRKIEVAKEPIVASTQPSAPVKPASPLQTKSEEPSQPVQQPEKDAAKQDEIK